MSSPRVSVVISVYRRSTYLARAVESVLDQTFQDLEILVTEDGGSDCASEVLSAFSDPRIRLIRRSENLGAGVNKLEAWRQAAGRYLVNLDDDDLIHRDFVARLVAPLEHDLNLVVSFCDYYVIDADGRVDPAQSAQASRSRGRDRLPAGKHRPIFDLGPVEMTIPFAVGCMWARERLDLDLFRVESGPAYDLFMVYVAAKSGLGAFYVAEKLSYYRRHDQMETVLGRVRIGQADVFCYDLFSRDADLAPWRSIFLTRAASARRQLAAEYLRQGDSLAARRWFREAMDKEPLDLKSRAGLLVSYLPAIIGQRGMGWVRTVRSGCVSRLQRNLRQRTCA